MADDGFFDIAQVISMGAQSSGVSADDAIIPLWVKRPDIGPDRLEPHAWMYVNPKKTPATGPQYSMFTADAAENAFLDMTVEEKKQFVAAASRVGLVGKTPSGSEVASAWAKAVGLARQYNTGKSKDKWLSPWEAMDKLALYDAAGNGAGYDGFTRTQTQRSVRNYTQSELSLTAEQILRKELGRGPTKAELTAYTIAVNNASKSSPEVSTQTVTQDGSGNTSSSTVNSGGIDPAQVITDSARTNPERAKYQAAAVYLPTLLNALGAVA